MLSYPKLSFSRGNAKLSKLEKKYNTQVWHFSLMSGHTCPGAVDCLSKAVIGLDGKWRIEDGPDTQFRCFSASQEVLYPSVRAQRIANMAILELAAQDWVAAGKAIVKQIPQRAGIIRLHIGGDLKTQAYFDAWTYAAVALPGIRFYAYTKMLPLWIKRRGVIPSNFVLTASKGGKWDHLIESEGLRFAQVVYSEAEAAELGLPIDHDDSLAVENGGSFALLIHGVQPKGSEAAKALKELNGVGSYSSGV